MSIESEALAKTLHENATLAAEIKRLGAEKLATAKTLTHLSANNEALTDENKELRARIALLESALGLPEGCDVFELQRAMKEGARTADGEVFIYDKKCYKDGDAFYLFTRQKDGCPFWFCKQGYHVYGAYRLYCIKEVV